MKIKVFIFAFTVLFITTADARFVQFWDYKDLASKSNQISIVQLLSPTQVIDKTIEHQKQKFNVCVTKFKVLATLKGNTELKEIKLRHYQYPKDINIIINGFGFINFEKSDDNTYMIFLKSIDNNWYAPTTGQWDTRKSFLKIPDDSPTSIIKWEKNNKSHTDSKKK